MRKIIESLFSALLVMLLTVSQTQAAVDASSGRMDVMSFAGSFNQSIPIPVAPGRAGMQPALSLNYSSTMGNSLYGTGWSMDLTRIERETKDGGVLYTDEDKFVLVMKGARQALVAVGGGQYRVANESAFLKIVKHADNSWSIRDQNNTLYTLAAPWPMTGARTFSWSLSSVNDIHGNLMSYTYKDGGMGHRLTRVDYGVNNSVVLYYDGTREDVSVNYRSGIRKVTRARLNAVKSFAGNVLASHISFTYSNFAAQKDYRSLLTKVTVHDPEGKLPSRSTSYSYERKTTSSPTGHWKPVTHGVNDTSHRTKVFYSYQFNGNGDKVIDGLRVVTNVTLTGPVVTFPKVFTPPYDGLVVKQYTYNTSRYDGLVKLINTYPYHRAIVDMQGDGYLDWMVKDSTGNWRLYSNSGSPTKVTTAGGLNIAGATVADANGLNTAHEVWVDPAGTAGFRAFYDVNGDGLPDLLSTANRPDMYPAQNWTVYLNRGDHFDPNGYSHFFSQSPYPLADKPGGMLSHAAPDILNQQEWNAAIVMSEVRDDLTGMNKKIEYVRQTGIHGMRNGWGDVIQSPESINLINTGMNSGIYEAPPEMVLWTVNRVSSQGPKVETRSVAYSHLGARLDKVTGEFRGFANVIQTDEQTGVVTQTTYAQDIVYQGRPTKSVTTLNGITLSDSETVWVAHEYDAGKRHFAYPKTVTKNSYDPLSGNLIKSEETNNTYSVKGLLLSSTSSSGPLLGSTAYTTRTVNSYQRNGQCGTVPEIRTRMVPLTRQVQLPETRTRQVTKMVRQYVSREWVMVPTVVNEPYTVMVPQFQQITKTRQVPQTRVRYVPQTQTQMVYTYIPEKREWKMVTRRVRGELVNRYQWVITPAHYAYVPTTVTVQVPQNYTVMVTETYTVQGPPLMETVQVPQNYTVQVPDPNCFLQDKLIQAKVTATSPDDQAGKTRTSSFAYKPNGLLKSETIEPGSGVWQSTTYGYDGWGNRTTTTVTGAGITARTTTVAYDANGMFPVSTTNALKHTESYTWDPRFGKKKSLTGPNGLTTSWSYDGFGRKIREDRADGTATVIDLSKAPFEVTTSSTGAPASTVYYDAMGREYISRSVGFDGSFIYNEVAFDHLGRKVREYLPRYNAVRNGSEKFTEYTYDDFGRVIRVTAPDGNFATSSYSGLTVTATNAKGQTTTTVKNVMDKVESVTDADLKKMSYSYDAHGNLIRTEDAFGNVTTMSYDIRGRKSGMVDPDMGSWSYEYDALGNLTKQTDAKGQVTTMHYDALSRMVSRIESEGTSSWIYDTLWKGALTSESGGMGSKAYAFDTFGRVKSTTTKINGQPYTVSTSYVPVSAIGAGQVETITYPNGTRIKRNYHAVSGALESVTNVSTGAELWRATQVDQFGHVAQERFGNNVETSYLYDNVRGTMMGISSVHGGVQLQDFAYDYDAVGNMKYRHDRIVGYKEQFILPNGMDGYDSLNRIRKVWDINGVQTHRYDINEIGNITFKTGVGVYQYNDPAHKHAVTNAGGNAYSYDANGNMRLATFADGTTREHSWSSFNKPTLITTAQGSTEYGYDAGHNRVWKRAPTNAGFEVTHYVGKIFERRTLNGLSADYVHVYAGSKMIATIKDAAGQVTTSYMHADHLGSVNLITNEQGGIVERLRFDVFGLPIDPSTGVAKADFGTANTTRGYTGHEMDASTGLINMNARLYDPVLGRFISADTVVPYADNMQSYNRYSYVRNNPLMYTDPSGHFDIGMAIIGIAAGIITAGVATAIVAAAQGVAITYGMSMATMAASFGPASYAMVGAIAGGLSSALMGGNLKDIANGAIAGAMFGYIHGASKAAGWASGSWEKVASHAAGGAARSLLYGDDPLKGALSAAVAQAGAGYIDELEVGPAGRAVVAGAVGGVAASLVGGKFAHGFATAAFARLFNDELGGGSDGTYETEEWQDVGLVERPVPDPRDESWKTTDGVMISVGGKGPAKKLSVNAVIEYQELKYGQYEKSVLMKVERYKNTGEKTGNKRRAFPVKYKYKSMKNVTKEYSRFNVCVNGACFVP